jgi:ribosomal-protein-alanine acetyltransferase
MYLAELQNVGVSFCYLARDEQGMVVGFCSFWHVVDELHVNNLAVLPAYRRRGIGTSLLLSVLKEGARLGARRATLEVRRSNEVARRLYERFGFGATGVRRAYYTNPVEDAACCGASARSLSARADLATAGALCYVSRSRDRHAAAEVDPSDPDPRSRRRSMNGQGQQLKELLLRTDEEFHSLADKHHQLEDRLSELTTRPYLSEPEVKINLKAKLGGRMEDILRVTNGRRATSRPRRLTAFASFARGRAGRRARHVIAPRRRPHRLATSRSLRVRVPVAVRAQLRNVL